MSQIIQEYMAEAYLDRKHRSEVWAFRLPARFAEVGESLFIRPIGLLGWRVETQNPTGRDVAEIKRIDRDERWRVVRFKLKTGWLWAEWTPWMLEEDEIFLDAMHNPHYARGGRRHET